MFILSLVVSLFFSCIQAVITQPVEQTSTATTTTTTTTPPQTSTEEASPATQQSQKRGRQKKEELAEPDEQPQNKRKTRANAIEISIGEQRMISEYYANSVAFSQCNTQLLYSGKFLQCYSLNCNNHLKNPETLYFKYNGEQSNKIIDALRIASRDGITLIDKETNIRDKMITNFWGDDLYKYQGIKHALNQKLFVYQYGDIVKIQEYDELESTSNTKTIWIYENRETTPRSYFFLSPDNKHLACVSPSKDKSEYVVDIFNTETGKLLCKKFHEKQVVDVIFSDNNTITVQTVKDFSNIPFPENYTSLHLSHNKKILIIGTQNGMVYFYDVSHGTLIHSFHVTDTSKIHATALSSDNKFLAVASDKVQLFPITISE